jgi:hypothetical protein
VQGVGRRIRSFALTDTGERYRVKDAGHGGWRMDIGVEALGLRGFALRVKFYVLGLRVKGLGFRV